MNEVREFLHDYYIRKVPARVVSDRVDFRLNYSRLDRPRECHSHGIEGPPIPNAYYGREGYDGDELGSGDWEDPGHPEIASAKEHFDHWFTSAVRESIHEALEWFWVDDQIYLNPHGEYETKIHQLSEEFAEKLLALRNQMEPYSVVEGEVVEK